MGAIFKSHTISVGAPSYLILKMIEILLEKVDSANRTIIQYEIFLITLKRNGRYDLEPILGKSIKKLFVLKIYLDQFIGLWHKF